MTNASQDQFPEIVRTSANRNEFTTVDAVVQNQGASTGLKIRWISASKLANGNGWMVDAVPVNISELEVDEKRE